MARMARDFHGKLQRSTGTESVRETFNFCHDHGFRGGRGVRGHGIRGLKSENEPWTTDGFFSSDSQTLTGHNFAHTCPILANNIPNERTLKDLSNDINYVTIGYKLTKL